MLERRFFAALLLFAFAPSGSQAAGAAEPASPPSQSCVDCLKIRVGLPEIVRGPAADIADNRFTELQLPGGGFRGFDAHNDTRAIGGSRPTDMGGPSDACSGLNCPAPTTLAASG